LRKAQLLGGFIIGSREEEDMFYSFTFFSLPKKVNKKSYPDSYRERQMVFFFAKRFFEIYFFDLYG
jgi:hypothetical protein